jgi:polar amino acid transport system permease protein
VFSFAVIQRNLPIMLEAAALTGAIALTSIAIGLVIGFLICVCRVGRGRVLRTFGALYVSFFRGVPLLVQLLLFYYLLPFAGLNVPSLVAAITTLALCTGAYLAEILRGGFLGIPEGAIEAARVLGLTRWQTRLRIQGPLALRLTLPAIINESIMILKASSLVSVVGVAELTRVSQNISASTFRPLEIYLAAGVLYLALNAILALTGVAAERRFARARA